MPSTDGLRVLVVGTSKHRKNVVDIINERDDGMTATAADPSAELDLSDFGLIVIEWTTGEGMAAFKERVLVSHIVFVAFRPEDTSNELWKMEIEKHSAHGTPQNSKFSELDSSNWNILMGTVEASFPSVYEIFRGHCFDADRDETS